MNIHVLNNKNTKEPILITGLNFSIRPKRAAEELIQKHGSGTYDFSFYRFLYRDFTFISYLAEWSVLSGCKVDFIGEDADQKHYYICLEKFKKEYNYDELQHIFPDPVYW